MREHNSATSNMRANFTVNSPFSFQHLVTEKDNDPTTVMWKAISVYKMVIFRLKEDGCKSLPGLKCPIGKKPINTDQKTTSMRSPNKSTFM